MEAQAQTEPDGYLSSGDDLSWAEPRAVRIRREATAADGGARLVVDVDPPVMGSAGPTNVVVFAPRHPDEHLTELPVHVHVLLPRGHVERLDLDSLEHAAWATLYRTLDEARRARDRLVEADRFSR